MSRQAFVWILGVLIAVMAGAGEAQTPKEPKHCQLQEFLKTEVPIEGKKITRLHVYKIGQIHLAGLGVGESHFIDVAALAEQFSVEQPDPKYCTWYFNSGNEEAELNFSHKYLTNPRDLSSEEGYEMYGQALEQILHSDSSMIDCLSRQKYIALGCNGMKHRGPTVFGMILAYSGCSTDSSLKIVNHVWGLNGVPSNIRRDIIQAGRDLAGKNPSYSREVQRLLGEEKQ